MSYSKRRYQVVNGRLQKNWNGDQDGWFATKAEAWGDLMADEKPKVEAADISQATVVPMSQKAPKPRGKKASK